MFTDHLLGKKALHYNLADFRTDRETDEGGRVEFSHTNCEVAMVAYDSEKIGLHKLLKKEKAALIPVKAAEDLDVTMARVDELASRIDLSISQAKFAKLIKGLDAFNSANGVDVESVDDQLLRLKQEKSRRAKVKLQTKLERLDKEECVDDPRAVSQERRRDRDDPFASIAGMKVRKTEGETQTIGTIIGGRKDGNMFSFTVIWDTADRAQTEHNLEEITALMAPMNDQGIVHQKIAAFQSVSIATPQVSWRRRLQVVRRDVQPEDMLVDDAGSAEL